MSTPDLTEIDKHLQARVSSFWFAATVQADPTTSARLSFEASTLRDGEQLRYQASYGVAEIQREGVHSIVDRFVEAARRNLPPGTKPARLGGT